MTMSSNGKTKVVGIDFDGVIVEFNGWKGSDHVGEVRWSDRPIGNLERLKELDFKIMIYTCRSKLSPVREVLKKHCIPYDYVNENPHQPESVSERKIFADHYIDDRFPGFVSLTRSVDLIVEEEDR